MPKMFSIFLLSSVGHNVGFHLIKKITELKRHFRISPIVSAGVQKIVPFDHREPPKYQELYLYSLKGGHLTTCGKPCTKGQVLSL